MSASETPSTWASKNARNHVRLGAWTTAWVLTMAVATFGPKFAWDGDPLISSLAIAVNFGIGIGMIIAHKNLVQDLDELQKKIQLEAMGISLGVGLITGLSYSTLDIANVISWDAEIGHLVLVQGITYMIVSLIGQRRYQ